MSRIDAESPTRVRFVVLGWACALAIVTYMHRVGFSAIVPSLRGPLGLDEHAVGYFMAAFMVAYGLFEVPWGLLGDARGARSALVGVVVGGSLMTAAVAAVVLLPNPARMGLGFLIVLRFLFAAFQAGTFPLLARVMADWMPAGERGAAQGAIWMASRVGGALAPLILIPLFRRFDNWRIPLILGAGLGLAWCVGFWPWFRNTPDEMPRVNAAERELISRGRKPKPVRVHNVPWGRIFGRSNPLALLAMYGCIGYSGNFFLFFLSDYLEKKRLLSKETSLWLMALPFIGGAFACVLGGILSDRLCRRWSSRRWGRRAVGAAGLTIAAAGMLAIPFVTDVRLLAVVLCVTFIGNDLAMGPAWAAATEIGDRLAGTLGGTMNMIGSFVAATSALVSGDQFARGDVTTPFFLFGLSYAIGALCWLRIDVTEPLGDTVPCDLAE